MFFCFPRDLLLGILSLITGFDFLYSGWIKVSTYFVTEEMQSDIKEIYDEFAKMVPVLNWFGVELPGDNYRLAIGYIEMLCSFLILIIPGYSKTYANWTLLVLTIHAKRCHFQIDEKFYYLAPGYFIIFLLIFRLIIECLVRNQAESVEKISQRIEVSMLGFSPSKLDRYEIDPNVPEPKIIETMSTLVPGYTHREFADKEQEELFHRRLRKRRRD